MADLSWSVARLMMFRRASNLLSQANDKAAIASAEIKSGIRRVATLDLLVTAVESIPVLTLLMIDNHCSALPTSISIGLW